MLFVSRILDISVKDNAKKVVDNTIGWVAVSCYNICFIM